MDVQAQIDAVDRTVEVRSGGTLEYAQALARTYPSPIDDVWDAVTSAERIERWFLPVTGDLRVGGSYQLVGNAGGEVRSCEPPADGRAEYTITWGMGGEPALVTVTLTGVDDETTRLDLSSVAAASAIPEGFWEKYGPGAMGVGWDQVFLGLGLHLAGDTSITPDSAMEWQLSEEGFAYVRASATAWGAAHVASGANEDDARAAADTTFGFYTGTGG